MNSALLLCALFSSSASVGQDSVQLNGLVEDEQGSPVEGAEIWVMGLQDSQPNKYAQAKTDRDGRFRVEIAAAAKASPYGGYALIWARSAARRLAWQSVNLAELSAEPVRMVASPRSTTTLKVVDPDGKAVPGAKVRAAKLQRGTLDMRFGYAIVPDELSIELAATSNDEGVAELPEFAPDELAAVRVETDRFGVQLFGRVNEKFRFEKLALARVGSLVGRLTGGEPKAAAGTVFDISTHRAEPNTGAAVEVYSMGYARVTVDESGRFEVPRIAAGKLTIQVHSTNGSAFRAQPPTDVLVAEDKETLAEIPLKRAIRVRGVVRERGSGKPIAGAGVGVVSNNTTNELFVTNDEGKFEGAVLPGSLVVHVFAPPKPYISQFFGGGQSVDVAESKGEHTFEPIELLRGVSLRGKVVDDMGEPVAGATVTAAWTMHEESFSVPKSESARTDKRGEFLLEGVDPRGELRLTAAYRDASTVEPTVALSGAKEPLVLRISTAVNVAAAGRGDSVRRRAAAY